MVGRAGAAHSAVAGKAQSGSGPGHAPKFSSGVGFFSQEREPGEMPAPSERILDGKMWKKAVGSQGIKWQPRFAILCDDILCFSRMIEGSVQGQAHWMHSKQLKSTEKNLEHIFHKFDDNGNGTLDVEEARKCLHELKLYSNDEDIHVLFDSLDQDGSGYLDLEEFKLLAKYASITNYVVDYIPLQEIREVEWEIVPKEGQRRRKVKSVEEEEVVETPGCLAALESILGVDIDGDGDDGSEKLPPWNPETHELHFLITTVEDGHNSGKTYVHQLPPEDAQTWIDTLRDTVSVCKRRVAREELESKYGESRWTLMRALVHKTYHGNMFQYTTAAFIIGAFVVDMVEAQVLPTPNSQEETNFFIIDAVFTAIFTLELIINIFAHSNDNFKPFYKNKANWFDFFIVVVSVFNVILTASGVDLSNIKILRLLRLGRAIRLFNSLKDLQRLLAAVSEAVYPVCNAFLILLIVAAVYAILGTNFFRERSPEYFGDFLTSLFTMFQVLSGDSWASGISRSLFALEGGGRGKTETDVAFFFVSYLLINSVMLLNVVVAVLLDEFISSVTREKEEAERLRIAEIERRKVQGTLDPITKELIAFDDDEDLQAKIDIMYNRLDVDHDGGLGFEEFQENIKDLGHTNIHVTRDDFDIITENGKFLGPKAEFNSDQFRKMMNGELWRYSRRQLTNVLQISGDDHFNSTILMLKIMESHIRKCFSELDKKLHTIQLHLGCHAQEPIFITDLNVGKDPDRAAEIQAAAPGLCSASGAVQPNSGQTSPIHAAQQVEVGHMHEMVRVLGKMHVDMQKMSAKIDKQTAELNELKMSSPQTRRLASPSDVVVVGKENGNASSSSRSLSRLAQADALAAGIRKARLAAGSQPPTPTNYSSQSQLSPRKNSIIPSEEGLGDVGVGSSRDVHLQALYGDS